MKITELKTEYRDNPIGLDNPHPRFSWILESEDRDVRQQAYRIVVKTDEETLWDTGRVEKDSSVLIPYEGKPFSPCSAYLVQVQVWDNKGNTDWREAGFETGLLSGTAFQAAWITHGFPKEETACPVFFKDFLLPEKRGRKLPLSGFMPPHWGCMKSG